MANTTRSTCWSLTIANPTPKEEEQIALARQHGWEVTGQLEKGEGGLVHYQLMLKTPQVRFSAVKKLFSTAHIEVARNPKALETYVAKEDSRVATLPTQQNMYPSLSKYWILVTGYLNDRNYVDAETSNDWWKKETGNLDALGILDQATIFLIDEGYVVEGIASNPSTRTAWKKYHFAIYRRAMEQILQQTDRQTDTAFIETEYVHVPMINEATLGQDVSLSGTDEEEDNEEASDEGSSVEGSDFSD